MGVSMSEAGKLKKKQPRLEQEENDQVCAYELFSHVVLCCNLSIRCIPFIFLFES